MLSFTKKYKIEIIIFSIALVLRLIYFSIGFSHNDGDLIKTIKGDDGYYELSQNIIQGNGFSFDSTEPYKPNPLRPPVWPFVIAFIADFFNTYWAVFVFEVLLGSLIPILGIYIARRLFDQKIIWLGAGILLAVEPYSVFLSTVFYTETFFTFFFLLACILLFKYLDTMRVRLLVWSSVCFSLALLTKPTIQYLPLLIPFIFYFHLRKTTQTKTIVVHSVLFMVIVGVFTLPWLYRNYHEFGVWGMSAQPAYNVFMYLAPSAMSLQKGVTLQEATKYISGEEKFDDSQINLSNAEYYTSRGLEVIKENPIGLLKSVAITGVTFFTHDGMLTFLQYIGIRPEMYVGKPAIALMFTQPFEFAKIVWDYARSPFVLVLIVRLFWFIVACGFLFGVYKRLHTRLDVFLIVAVGLVIYFVATTSVNGLGVNARFKVPVNVFIFTFALYGFLVTWYNIRNTFKKDEKTLDSYTGI